MGSCDQNYNIFDCGSLEYPCSASLRRWTSWLGSVVGGGGTCCWETRLALVGGGRADGVMGTFLILLGQIFLRVGNGAPPHQSEGLSS